MIQAELVEMYGEDFVAALPEDRIQPLMLGVSIISDPQTINSSSIFFTLPYQNISYNVCFYHSGCMAFTIGNSFETAR